MRPILLSISSTAHLIDLSYLSRAEILILVPRVTLIGVVGVIVVEMKDEEVFSAIVPVVMGSNAFDEVLLG